MRTRLWLSFLPWNVDVNQWIEMKQNSANHNSLTSEPFLNCSVCFPFLCSSFFRYDFPSPTIFPPPPNSPKQHDTAGFFNKNWNFFDYFWFSILFLFVILTLFQKKKKLVFMFSVYADVHPRPKNCWEKIENKKLEKTCERSTFFSLSPIHSHLFVKLLDERKIDWKNNRFFSIFFSTTLKLIALSHPHHVTLSRSSRIELFWIARRSKFAIWLQWN